MSKSKEKIHDLVAGNLNGLGRLCSLFESQDQPSQSLVQSYLARFKLWAGSLGAHRTSGTRSLEYRLRDASSIRKHLVSLLKDLMDIVVREVLPFLESSHDAEGDSDTGGDPVDEELAGLFNAGSEDVLVSSTKGHNNELNYLLSGIGNVIDCLLRLSVTISNPAPHDHFRSRAGIEFTPFFEHYDTQHVRQKYPNIQPKLSERLGRMLAYRRRYFRYRVDHHSRLTQGLEGTVDDGATTVASSLPQALKDGHQVHLVVENDDRSEISATSYAPSTLDQSELRVPPIPKEYVDGPFLCPFCYVIIAVDTRHDWKKHVFRDLRPYACLIETCLVDQDFPRRKDWTLHMQEDHWRAWSCPFGCAGEYQSSSALRKHFHKRHKPEVMKQDVEAIINLSSKADLSCAEGSCPLCHEPIRSSHQYQSHVGHHLEQLALFVLPTPDDNVDDEEPSSDDDEEPSDDEDEGSSDEDEDEGPSDEDEDNGPSDEDEDENVGTSDEVGEEEPSEDEEEGSSDEDEDDGLSDDGGEARLEEMRAQLKLLQAERGEQEESKKRADMEQKIREDSERAFKIRMEEMQKAQGEAKKKIELAKIPAEKAARGRIEEERKADPRHQRQHAELLAKAEADAKEKYMAALEAEEKRRLQQEEERKRAEETARLRYENEVRVLLEKERLDTEEAKMKEESIKKRRAELFEGIEEETKAKVWAESAGQNQTADQPGQDASDAESQETTQFLR